VIVEPALGATGSEASQVSVAASANSAWRGENSPTRHPFALCPPLKEDFGRPARRNRSASAVPSGKKLSYMDVGPLQIR
jgi:hypothetical protein